MIEEEVQVDPVAAQEKLLLNLHKELEAMDKCFILLQGLPRESAYRALRWITAKLHEGMYDSKPPV